MKGKPSAEHRVGDPRTLGALTTTAGSRKSAATGEVEGPGRTPIRTPTPTLVAPPLSFQKLPLKEAGHTVFLTGMLENDVRRSLDVVDGVRHRHVHAAHLEHV